MNANHMLIVAISLFFWPIAMAHSDEPDLVGYWKLAGDVKDHSAAGNHGRDHHVDLERTAAGFDGKRSFVEVPNSKSLELGAGEFSLCLWAHTEKNLDDVLGDLASKYDPLRRSGFNFSIQNLAGVTSAQSNYRHVHFGIDAGNIDPKWTDCGRPGNNLCVFALCAYQGNLYAGTFEHGKDEAGHVYRYDGGTRWVDCGSPDKCNAVQSLAVYDGKLYAGAGRYLSRGSSLAESPNEIPGGKVYRYEGSGKWTDCGKLENPETGESFTVGGMAVYRGQLYAGVSKPAGRGLYRYDGERKWKYLGNPGHRVTNPVVYNGKMYFCSLDGGGITRYDGDGKWTAVGKPADVTQTYGFAIYQGNLYTSSWPNGEVFRYDNERSGKQSWIRSGRLGDEKEVMGMAVYNGKLYAGTLPLAQVYRYDGGTRWHNTGQLDKTPNVRYRRAWSMAVFGGKLYCGTLPSGHVFSVEAGKSVTYDHALPAGWVHLAAVRGADRLRLYLNGKLVATSSQFKAADYDISNEQPLKIGFGAHDYFNGKLKDVRCYRGALTDREIAKLAKDSAPPLGAAPGLFDATNPKTLALKTVSARQITGPAGPVRFEEHLISGGYTYSFGIAAADLDGDGDLDLTSADALPNNALYWFENDGRAGFKKHFIQKNDPQRLERHAIGDIDKDGHPDVVIVKNLFGDLLWFKNSGKPADGKLWKRHVITGKKLPGAYDVALADYDGDGDLDVAASSWRLSNNFAWFENDGTPADGEWKMHLIEADVKETRMIRAADLDGDKDPDLIGSAREAPLVVWYENTGKPAERWKKHVIDAKSVQPIHGEVADMDRDGDLDVLMAFGMGFSGNAKSEQIAWYENDGTPAKGGWKKHIIRQGVVGAFEAVTADLDGDKDLDVVATVWNGPGQVLWFENLGDPKGHWTMHVIKAKWRRANQVITPDLDGDGKPDVVAGAERGSNEVRWWRNLGPSQR